MEAEGHIIPELDNQPELYEDLQPYFKAFDSLSGSRDSGFGMGYIKYDQIVCYLNEQDVRGSETREDYVRWIQFIDNEFVKLHNKKD